MNFFLLIAALNLFAINADESHDKHDLMKEHLELTAIKNPREKQAMMRVYEKQYKAVIFIKKHYNLVIMSLLPLMALVFRVFYRKATYNFTEHLIAGMYMYGFCTLLFVIMALLNLIFRIDNNYIYYCSMLFQLVYFSNFYYTFMQDGRKLKAFTASLFALLTSFVGSGVVVAIYAML